MPRLFAILWITLAVFGCDTERPPLVGDNGPAMPPPSGGRDAGSDASIDATTPSDASSDASDGSTEDFVCVPSGSNGNTLTLIEQGPTPTFSFTAQNVFSRWVPDACTPGRDIQIGFDTDACGFDSGDILSFSLDAQQIDDGFILPFSTLLINPMSLVSIRLQTSSGSQRGNCIGSGGILNLQDLTTDGQGTIRGNFANMILTDCGDDELSSVAGTGSFSITLPDGCLP